MECWVTFFTSLSDNYHALTILCKRSEGRPPFALLCRWFPSISLYMKYRSWIHSHLAGVEAGCRRSHRSFSPKWNSVARIICQYLRGRIEGIRPITDMVRVVMPDDSSLQARLICFRTFRQISRQALKQINIIEHMIDIIKEMQQRIVSPISEQ